MIISCEEIILLREWAELITAATPVLSVLFLLTVGLIIKIILFIGRNKENDILPDCDTFEKVSIIRSK